MGQNKKCHINLEGPEINTVPYEASELLRKMLAKNPLERITAI